MDRTYRDGAAAGLTNVLFVPGSRPDRFAKALASGADLVCIDLEDAVPAKEKAAGRAAAVAAIAPRMAIRTNAVTTREGLADLLAIADCSTKPAVVFLPMVESTGEIAVARGTLGDAVGLIALIETPLGVARAGEIAAAPGIEALMFGGGDMAAALNVAIAWEPLLAARQAVVMACAAAGVPAIDVPWIALDDPVGLAEEARRAKAFGFQAKAAIHPDQLEAIRTAMRPSPALVSEARAALAAHEAGGGGAIGFNGRMLEAPIVRRYRRVLELAGASDNA